MVEKGQLSPAAAKRLKSKGINLSLNDLRDVLKDSVPLYGEKTGVQGTGPGTLSSRIETMGAKKL